MEGGESRGTRFDVPGAVWTLVRTDFKVRYHGTIMGFFWALLKPLMMLGVLLVVFSFIFGSTPNYATDLVIGIFLYEFFSESTKTGLTSLHQKGYLINRSCFPRWIFAVTAASNALITLLAFSIGIMIFLIVIGRPPSLGRFALYLVYMAHYVAIVTGFSLGTSVLFVRYRDLNQIWDVLIQMGFFVAPVIYPLGVLPEKYHLLLYVWPPTPILEFSRAVLTGEAIPSPTGHLLLTGLAGGCLALGGVTYRLLAPRAAEYL